MDVINLAIVSFLYILPAYIANSSAALFGGGLPLDMGKKLGKHRILGDGKTFRGLFVGIVFGTTAGSVIGFFASGTEFGIGSINFYTLLGFLLSSGAMLGDLIKSFFKRRLGFERGQMLPLIDQLDFVVGAIVLGSLIYVPTLAMVVFLIIITPIIHLLLNVIGYLLKLKKVPW
jgi:CDP-2,3-bis-(O-geranylgeranyl)-sn-glycerol synthase